MKPSNSFAFALALGTKKTVWVELFPGQHVHWKNLRGWSLERKWQLLHTLSFSSFAWLEAGSAGPHSKSQISFLLGLSATCLGLRPQSRDPQTFFNNRPSDH